jgi:hypothetical protein
VGRRFNQPGVGGRDVAAQSHLIGTIKMFYHFDDLGGQQHTFVDIANHHIIEKIRSMYIVDTCLTLRTGFNHHPILAESTIIHIDAITSKVLLVPHFAPEYKDVRMCAIPMWEAR